MCVGRGAHLDVNVAEWDPYVLNLVWPGIFIRVEHRMPNAYIVCAVRSAGGKKNGR